MRRIVTGTNAQGRSCIVQDGEVDPAVIEGLVGIRSGSLCNTTVSPPEIAPPQFGRRNDVALDPGALRSFIVEHEPPGDGDGAEVATTMHYQPALELVFLLEGSLRLVLDEEETEVRAGDFVIMPGVDHAFLVGPSGSKALVIAVGMTPSD
jgi:mannose-6-phosphate isomerase-like protein (cupin superfamily)